MFYINILKRKDLIRPYYEYKCNICGRIIECKHGIHVYRTKLICFKCEKQINVTKLISLSTFKLVWKESS